MNSLIGIGVMGTFGQPGKYQQEFYFDVHFHKSLDVRAHGIQPAPDTVLFAVRKEMVNGTLSLCFCQYTYTEELNAQGDFFIGSCVVLQGGFTTGQNIYRVLVELHDDMVSNPLNVYYNIIRVSSAAAVVVREPMDYLAVRMNTKPAIPYPGQTVKDNSRFLVLPGSDHASNMDKAVIEFFDHAIMSFPEADALYLTTDDRLATDIMVSGAMPVLPWEQFLYHYRPQGMALPTTKKQARVVAPSFPAEGATVAATIAEMPRQPAADTEESPAQEELETIPAIAAETIAEQNMASDLPAAATSVADIPTAQQAEDTETTAGHDMQANESTDAIPETDTVIETEPAAQTMPDEQANAEIAETPGQHNTDEPAGDIAEPGYGEPPIDSSTVDVEENGADAVEEPAMPETASPEIAIIEDAKEGVSAKDVHTAMSGQEETIGTQAPAIRNIIIENEEPQPPKKKVPFYKRDNAPKIFLFVLLGLVVLAGILYYASHRHKVSRPPLAVADTTTKVTQADVKSAADTLLAADTTRKDSVVNKDSLIAALKAEIATPKIKELSPQPNMELSPPDIVKLKQSGLQYKLLSEVVRIIFDHYPDNVGIIYKNQEREYGQKLMNINKGCFQKIGDDYMYAHDSIMHIPAYKNNHLPDVAPR